MVSFACGTVMRETENGKQLAGAPPCLAQANVQIANKAQKRFSLLHTEASGSVLCIPFAIAAISPYSLYISLFTPSLTTRNWSRGQFLHLDKYLIHNRMYTVKVVMLFAGKLPTEVGYVQRKVGHVVQQNVQGGGVQCIPEVHLFGCPQEVHLRLCVCAAQRSNTTEKKRGRKRFGRTKYIVE